MITSHMIKAIAALGIGGLTGVAQTQAAFIGVSGGDEDSQPQVSVAAHTGEAGQREIVHSIDGTGMTGNQDAGGVPLGSMALFRGNSGAHGGTVAGSHWGKYQFDQDYQISNIWIWNWNETNFPTFGWKNITIQTSLTGGTTAGEWTTVFTGQVPVSDGADPSAVDLIAPVTGGSILARYVMLTNTGTIATSDDGDPTKHENWSSGTGQVFTNDAGLSEVRFELVPEPASLGLIALGIPLILRRR